MIQQQQQQQHIVIIMDDDALLPTREELDADFTFELEEFDYTSVTGDGLYYPDNWLLLDGQLKSFYQSLIAAEAYPIFLNTSIRWQETDSGAHMNSEKISASKVHDRHPFIVFFVLA
jgi:hypothetical protein